MKLVIGNKNYSSWSLRPWLLMRQFDIRFAEVNIALYKPDSRPKLLAYSSAGKVPVLLDEGITVWDSLAIAEYLAEKLPALPIWPRDTQARARARSIAAEMHSGFTALRTHMPMNLRGYYPGQGYEKGVAEDILRITDIWQDCRRRHASEGPFLFGEFGAVDAFFAPVVTRFATYGVPLSAVVKEYSAAVMALPAMQEWKADALLETERIAASEPYSVTRRIPANR